MITSQPYVPPKSEATTCSAFAFAFAFAFASAFAFAFAFVAAFAFAFAFIPPITFAAAERVIVGAVPRTLARVAIVGRRRRNR